MKDSWDEQYVEYEVGKSAFKAVTDSIVDTQSAIKVLAITVTAELGAFAMFYFGKNEIYKFLESGDNVWVYAAIGTFLLGFLTAFAGLRLVPYRFRRRLLTYTVWGISVASGLANIALFYVLLTLRMR
jgi:hypothetical protein